jgi:hypothetical protein
MYPAFYDYWTIDYPGSEEQSAHVRPDVRHTDRQCGPRKVSHIIMVEGYLLFPITQHTSWSHHHRTLALLGPCVGETCVGDQV